jgi:hypothetical protein
MRTSLRRTLAAACASAACLATPAAAQDDATLLSGTWQGTYVCQQGETAVRLELRGNTHGMVNGVFRFSPMPLAPDVPRGEYPVLGRRVGASLVLRPVDVHELADGYKAVGLQGIVDGAHRELWGAVDGAACGDFGVEKIADADPADPLPGAYGAQVWEPVLEQGAATLFADGREYVPTHTGTAILWMRWRFDADSEQGRAGAARDYQVEYQCEARTSRIVSWVEYDPQGRIEMFDLLPSLQWMPVGEAEQPDALGYARVCREPLG